MSLRTPFDHTILPRPVKSSRRQFLVASAATTGAAFLDMGSMNAEEPRAPRDPVKAKPPTDPKIRLGWVGHNTRLQADTPYLGTAALSKIVKVVGISEATEKRRELCQEIVYFETGKKPNMYENYRALLEGEQLDGLLCAFSPRRSLPVYKACLEAGVHCFGSFPEVEPRQELRDLLGLQARHPGVKLQFSSPWRHQLRYREAARLVREDQVLGRLTGCTHRLVPRGGAGSKSWTFPGCDLVTWFTGRWPLRARPDSDPASPVVLEYSDDFAVRFSRGATTFHGTLGDMDATSGKIT